MMFLCLFAALCMMTGLLLQWAYLKKLDGIIKRGRVQGHELRAGHPEELPHLDVNKLMDVTHELRGMGFVPLGDFVSRIIHPHENPAAPLATPSGATTGSSVPPSPNDARGFARIFVNHERGVLAKIIAVTVLTPASATKGATYRTSFLTAFASIEGAGENYWSYTTSNRSPKGHEASISALFNRPRAVWTRMPGAPIADIWERHLSRREDIARAAGCTWKSHLHLEDALWSEKHIIGVMQNAFIQQNPLKLAWYFKRYPHKNPPHEWLSELQGKL